MNSPVPRTASHYRRRILGIGALLTFGLYVVGAPIVNNRIEDDLERRVPDELADVGFTGIDARFSGQDGTLTCDGPLDDPEAAIAAAYDVRGVRAIDLDRSCRVNRAPTVATTTTLAPPPTTLPSDSTDVDASTTPSVATTTSTTMPPDFATVADIVSNDPQFALFAVLADEAGVTATFGGSDEVTLFAPSDAAFDTVPADVIAELRTDPELLARVLRHHAVAGRHGSGDLADLADGTLVSLDGGELGVEVSDDLVMIDAAIVVDADIAAGNGVVHVIDGLLVPPDVDLTVPAPMASVTAIYDDGTVSFEGVVASEVERAVLAGSAGALAVDDQLEVDPDVGLDEATALQFARLVEAVRTHLLNGTVRYDGAALSVSGDFLGDVERDAMAAIADEVGAATELELRPDATDDDAEDLEAALNAFVAENPILFEPSSAILSDSAAAVIDRVAVEAQQFAGVAITVEGHTDSDGTATENRVLSQLRANAVRDALVALGIPAESVTATGFGSERPVLVDGAEDKNASRRVEFRVVSTR